MRRSLLSVLPDLKLLWVGLAVLALAGLPSAGAHTKPSVSAQQQTNIYMYAVKIVCVPDLGKADPALVPAMYRTAVNVHNPWPQPAKITKWLTLSPPQGEPAITGDRISETLESYQAFDVDCVHMATKFGLQGQKVPGGKGFLIIQSDQDLDVVGVYTSEQLVGAKTGLATEDSAEGFKQAAIRATGVGLGLDIEYIQPKIAPVVSQNPDLTVRITSPTTVVCPNGPGSCMVTVNFEIMNTSAVDVTNAFEVLIEADLVPFKTISVSGLGAGASQSFSEALGPGNNCFDPDCTVKVSVDSGNVIPESDEANNIAERTDIG
jgi:hypothetical protein